MTSLRFIFAALLASALLSSCNPFKSDHIDAKYPTVSQQDAYDVSWGLQPRKARGNPKMRYQYNSRAEQPAAAPMSLEPAAPAAAPSLPPAAAPSRAAAPATVPSNLR